MLISLNNNVNWWNVKEKESRERVRTITLNLKIECPESLKTVKSSGPMDLCFTLNYYFNDSSSISLFGLCELCIRDCDYNTEIDPYFDSRSVQDFYINIIKSEMEPDILLKELLRIFNRRLVEKDKFIKSKMRELLKNITQSINDYFDKKEKNN